MEDERGGRGCFWLWLVVSGAWCDNAVAGCLSGTEKSLQDGISDQTRLDVGASGAVETKSDAPNGERA